MRGTTMRILSRAGTIALAITTALVSGATAARAGGDVRV